MNEGRGPNQHGLPADVLSILQCPSCRFSLTATQSGLSCTRCGALYPSLNGVVRFVQDSNYVENFGFQWSRFARTQLDRDGFDQSEKDFRERTGFVPEDLVGKLVLDVGCGMGRFAEVATRWGARVVGVDLSKSC